MNVAIIGAPVDLGADRRGVDMGASAIRYAGLEPALRELGYGVRDLGNVEVGVAETLSEGTPNAKYLEPIIRMAERLAERVGTAIDEGYVPLVLGGDHSVSLGTVAGVTRRRRVGILWIDAHGDFNTPETSGSGNVHGMVLAALAGQGPRRMVDVDGRSPKVEPGNIALVGVRSLDEGERANLRSCGVHVFTMHDIDRAGLPEVIERAIARASAGMDGIHLSLDLDVVDPLQAPGVGTPVPGGLTFRETHLAMEMIATSGRLVSMEAVEVNPILDIHNETARLAVQFTLSALGKRIF
jgi:arginase